MAAETRARETERKAMPIRMPPDMHQDLRMLALFTGKSVNEIVLGLIGDYLAGTGRELIESGMTNRAKATYKDALDKLAEM